MITLRGGAVALAVWLTAPAPVQAHFLELIPSADILDAAGTRTVVLDALFTHPVEGGPVMDLAPPVQFGVQRDGQKTDLKSLLTERLVAGKRAWQASYKFSQPGNHIFYLEPAPYWDAAEKQFLVHYTKVIVDFAGGSGWEAPVGLPVEIIPLTRPYGLWTGNLFRGVVMKNGKPLAGATVEIEWINDTGIKVPADPFLTQEARTDLNGIFAYAMPRAGWWGFTALTDGKVRGADGKPAAAELGGTIWMKTVDLK